jgi:molybdenum cofactor guanylyltransferase
LRLGREKAFDKVGTKRLIERTIDCLSPVSQSVIIVTRQEQADLFAGVHLKGKVVVDLYPGKAALGGIYTGLMSADTSSSLVVGCDMPFLNRGLLQHLIDSSIGYDTAVPRLGSMLEPLHAVYSKRCLDSIAQLLGKGVVAAWRLFDLVKTRYVDEDEINRFDSEHLSFFNINTQHDLEKARSLARQMECC